MVGNVAGQELGETAASSSRAQKEDWDGACWMHSFVFKRMLFAYSHQSADVSAVVTTDLA